MTNPADRAPAKPPAAAETRETAPLIDSQATEANAQALEAMISSVPLRDYSDYEIEIESPGEFSDALYSDEADLDKALAGEAPPVDEAVRKAANRLASHQRIVSGNDNEPAPFNPTDWLPTAPLANADSSADEPDGAAELKLLKTALRRYHFADQTLYPQLRQHSFVATRVASDAQRHDMSTHRAHAEALTQTYPAFAQPLATRLLTRWFSLRLQATDYLGISLPARDRDLGWMIPGQKSHKHADGVMDLSQLAKLAASKKTAPAKLQAAAEQLTLLGKQPMAWTKRWQRLEALAEIAIPVITHHADRFRRKPSAAGDDKRLQILEDSRLCLKWLLAGYRQVFGEIYALPGWQYGPRRQQFQLVAVRLIDLAGLEQWTLQQCQIEVPPGSLKTLVSALIVLGECEPALITTPFTRQWRKQSTTPEDALRDYLCRSLFDWHSLSPRHHRDLSAALLSAARHLLLLDPADAARLPVGSPVVALHCGSTDQLELIPSAEAGAADLWLYAGHLGKQLYQACAKNQLPTTLAGHVSRCLEAAFTGKQALAFSNYIAMPWFGVAGLSDMLAWSRGSFYQQLVKQLPQLQRPVIKISASNRDWQAASCDGDRWHIQLDESKAALPLDCGQLLLLMVDPNRSADPAVTSDPLTTAIAPGQTIVARIHAMQRQPGHKLQLQLEPLADRALPVALIDPNAGDALVPADHHLLLIQHGNSWSLLTSPDCPVAENGQCLVQLPDNEQVTLQTGRCVRDDFCNRIPVGLATA